MIRRYNFKISLTAAFSTCQVKDITGASNLARKQVLLEDAPSPLGEVWGKFITMGEI